MITKVIRYLLDFTQGTGKNKPRERVCEGLGLCVYACACACVLPCTHAQGHPGVSAMRGGEKQNTFPNLSLSFVCSVN